MPHKPDNIVEHPRYPGSAQLAICGKCGKTVHRYDGSWRHMRSAR